MNYNSELLLRPELRFSDFSNSEEWRLVYVGDLLNVRNEKRQPSDEIPLFSLTIDSGITAKTERYNREFLVRDAKLKQYKLVFPNDIVYNPSNLRWGAINYSKISHAVVVSPIYEVLYIKDTNKTSLEFIAHLLMRNEQIKMFIKRAQGTLVERIAVKIDDFLITQLPYTENIEEQYKIAACLSSLDDVIIAETQKLEVLQEYKNGLLQNLFPQEEEIVPKYRFPEFKNPLEKVGYSELGDIKIGLTHKPDYISSGVPFLSSKNISNGYIDFKNVQYISPKKFESMPESTKPKLGDILFTRVGSNLGNPIVLEQDIEFGIFVSLGIFRVNKRAHNYYIKYWMESDFFWKQLNQKVAGGAKDNLNSTWLREFELFIPSIEEQEKIASCLSSLDECISAQSQKIQFLILHKKGLLQGLFPKINDIIE